MPPSMASTNPSFGASEGPPQFGAAPGPGGFLALPALTNQAAFAPPSHSAGLAPELAALVYAEEADGPAADGKSLLKPPEKKPRIILLVTRLAPSVEEGTLHRILEQCGDLVALRRGRDQLGEPMSFAFAQLGDPESAWKAMTCLTGLKLEGQELKVLAEESAEVMIQNWRASQQLALKVGSEEELAWELERQSVSCKAQIDSVVEEIYGATATDDKSGNVAFVAQRNQELRDRERARVERGLKRKAWREAEVAKLLERVESTEKKLRCAEREKDDADRIREGHETQSKDDQGKSGLGKHDGSVAIRLADNQQLCDMVDRVQAEPRDVLFKLELDLNFLRQEKILERKLRPWLERKVELCMGGAQSDLVEYILRRINAASQPDMLISDLMRFLDDSSEILVERMWRMLAFELHRAGHALQGPSKPRF